MNKIIYIYIYINLQRTESYRCSLPNWIKIMSFFNLYFLPPPCWKKIVLTKENAIKKDNDIKKWVLA